MHEPESPTPELPRRDLLRAGLTALGGTSALGLTSFTATDPGTAPGGSGDLVSDGGRVLFQGDSITDAGRSYEDAGTANAQVALGSGYAWLAAAGLLVERPSAGLEFQNRGVSGEKVYQLAARWDAECLALEPDVLSLLIGVNDYNHARSGTYGGTLEIYERDLDALLTRTRAALPEVRLVICEPFLLQVGASASAQAAEFALYRAAARRVADAHGARWVPFQSMFDEAVHYAPPEHWVPDGVHPSWAGAALMAQTWQRVVCGS